MGTLEQLKKGLISPVEAKRQLRSKQKLGGFPVERTDTWRKIERIARERSE